MDATWPSTCRVVRALNLQLRGPKFLMSRPESLLDLFSAVPSSNPWLCSIASQLVGLRPNGVFDLIKFDVNYLFQAFARPH